jgi:hypothetical protein
MIELPMSWRITQICISANVQMCDVDSIYNDGNV